MEMEDSKPSGGSGKSPRGHNAVVLIGHLTNDPEHVKKPNWHYLLFTVAVNTRPRKSKSDFVRTCFVLCQLPFPSEGMLTYLLAGRRVFIDGHLESYESEDRRRNLLNVSVDELILLDQKPKDEMEAENADLERAQGYAQELQLRNERLIGGNEELTQRLKLAEAELAALRVDLGKKAKKKVAKKTSVEVKRRA